MSTKKASSGAVVLEIAPSILRKEFQILRFPNTNLYPTPGKGGRFNYFSIDEGKDGAF